MSAANAFPRDFVESLALWRVWLHQGHADLLRRYRRTLLGPLWHTLSLGVFVIATGVIWAAIMKIELARYVVFLSAGLVAWGLISACVLEGATVLIAAQPLALSMRIPYPMLAMGLVWRLVLIFLHQLPLCVAAGLLFGGALAPATLLLVPATLVIAISGVWMALLAGLVTLRIRDAQAVLASLMHIVMFATPVFWSRELLGPELAHLADWNPLFHLVEIMRRPILGEVASATSWIVALGWAGGGLVLTLMVYARVRDRIAYWY